jgi:hypothetical protein
VVATNIVVLTFHAAAAALLLTWKHYRFASCFKHG